MMNSNTARLIYYIIIVSINLFGLLIVSGSFFGASNANGEGSPMQTDLEAFLWHGTRLLVFSLIIAGGATLISYLYRKRMNFTTRNLKRIFSFEIFGFMTLFLVIYFYFSTIA